MASSPRFWQKLGIGKQHKSTSSFTVNSDNQSQDGNFLRHSNSFCHQQVDSNVEAIINNNNTINSGKQVKRFSSNISLRHRASSASLHQLQQQQQQQQHNTEKQLRRSSYMKPLKRIDPENSLTPSTKGIKLSESMIPESQQQQPNIRKMPSIIGSATKLPTSTSALPTRKQSCIDISNNSNSTRQISPPRLNKTKSNQSLASTSTTTSVGTKPSIEQNGSNIKPNNSSRLRQPSPGISQSKLLARSDSNSSLHQLSTINKKKSLPKMPPPLPSVTNSSSGYDDDEESKSTLTRTSSNGSTATLERRGNRHKTSLAEKRKKSMAPAAAKAAEVDAVKDQCGDSFILETLKDELERERASVRALQGQKDAISKDLDYFCTLVDEVTEEKDEYKRSYEEEKNQNHRLKQTIKDLESR
ncbi:hypothetical protein BD408DRAFT_256505 [Parasitella parasitica]|nr:hypothetical protein BD408DRAFT_256505 [Parasitella parasitica]